MFTRAFVRDHGSKLDAIPETFEIARVSSHLGVYKMSLAYLKFSFTVLL